RNDNRTATTTAPDVVAAPEGQADATAGWQVYFNEDYGFEIKYPNGWMVGQNQSEGGIASIGDGASNSGFHIEELPNKGNLNFSQWYKLEVADKNKTEYRSEKKVINGIDMEVFNTVYHAINTRMVEGIEVYLADRKNRIIHIVAGGHGTKDVFEQILLTLKFITPEADEANDTAIPSADLPGNEIYDALFDKHKVAEKFSGTPAALDFSGDKGFLMFKARITDAYNAYKSGDYDDMIFGGHYVFTLWGCGTSCRAGVIIDLKDGKIHTIPGGETEAWPEWGYYFKENSNLLILNPIETTRCIAGTTDENGLLCPDTKFYLWENNRFNELPIDQKKLNF
ncbi:MAG: hypothetical protein MUD10_02500, partial [Candidatus Pacebacteria bacterium]|nr:hypothetical protein [Candidatus Paceibacterota bacterium]